MKKRIVIAVVALLVICLTIFYIGYEPKGPYDDMFDSKEKIAMQDQFKAKKEENVKLENGSYQYTAEGFSGTKTIWQYDAKEEDTIHFSYKLYGEFGKEMLVLVRPNQTVLRIAGGGGARRSVGGVSSEDSEFKVVKGLYKLKVVGADNPNISITLKISQGTWVK
ncbi:MAG: hypothetical protein E7L17_05775 [Clostridium sp.]|uniref:hypothetical protein n=1 Tax=Clostridium sp. TaxID=1506 RepID=UPI002906A08A|nr:hypothetical protein [Clostridium sp.]MDU7337608.1 hypothetical protein [Clostridium sp.]